MKIIHWLILINLIIISFLSSGVLAQENEKTHIAILDLKPKGITEDDASLLTENLQVELLSTGAFKIMERTEMNAILTEQKFQGTGLVSDDPNYAVQIGKIIGVKQIIIGSVGKIGTLYTITIKMVDVETSSILEAISEKCKGCEIDELYTETIPLIAYKLAETVITPLSTDIKIPYDAITVGKNNEDYKTIQEAIDNAKDGATIVVKPGIYGESLTIIDKTLIIFGQTDDKSEKIRVQTKGADCIHFKNSDTHIINISFEQIGEGYNYAITIASGAPTIEKCEIVGRSLDCVAIFNKADPIIRNNKIHNSKRAGILITDDAKGTIENNEIWNNAYAGIGVGTQADPIIIKNNIHDNKVGVFIYDRAKGSIEENGIAANNYFGIVITAHSSPIVRNNKIYNGTKGGILISDNGTGIIEDNDIWGNKCVGIELNKDADPIIRNNKIYKNELSGIEINNKAKGVIEDNEIGNNNSYGIEIKNEAKPIIKNNKIYENALSGIYIKDKAEGTIEENENYANTLSGIAITSQNNPLIRKNKVHHNNENGIYIFSEGKGIIEENEIWNNANNGLVIDTNGNPFISKNTIHNNSLNGIFVHHNGEGILENNEIKDNAYAGIKIESGGNPFVKNNKIYHNKGKGILIANEGKGKIEENDIYDNEFEKVEEIKIEIKDTDSDGISDNEDICPNEEGPKETKGCPIPSAEDISFKSGKAKLNPEAYTILDKIGQLLSDNPKLKLRIEGYTDSLGADDKNLELSENRANAIKTYLIQDFSIDPTRLEIKGYGEANPIADNKTEEGRAKNRRIEFVVIE